PFSYSPPAFPPFPTRRSSDLGVTSYLAHRDILPSHFRDLLPRPLSPLACLPARRLPGRPAGQHDLQRRLNRIRQEAVARPPGVHRNGGWHCRRGGWRFPCPFSNTRAPVPTPSD